MRPNGVASAWQLTKTVAAIPAPIVLIIAIGLGLAACDRTGLSGSASMRVEVEVYKGPLSKEMPIQRGELIGMIRDASTALLQLRYDTQVTMCRLGCNFSRVSIPHNSGDLSEQDSFCGLAETGYVIEKDDDPPDPPFRVCPILTNILDDAKELYADVCEFKNLDPTGFKCEDDGKQKQALIDRLAEGMIEATLANQHFTVEIARLVDQRIAAKAEEMRSRINERITAMFREEIERELRPERSKYQVEYRKQRQLALTEATRIRDNAAKNIRLVEDKLEALLLSTQEEEKSTYARKREREIEEIEEERDRRLKKLDSEVESRVSDIKKAYENLEVEIDARLRERQGEIFDRVEAELKKERQKLYDDPSTRQALKNEVRQSLREAAKEDAKSRLITEKSGELAKWIEPGENAVKFRVYRRAGKVAQRLRSRAEYWATAHTAVAPESKRVRIEMADFANFTASYGNQIGARADALLKQTEWNRPESARQGTALARELLASSTFLRDSQPTSYLRLYEWNDAAVLRGNSDAVDRVRMVEQLVKDTYWANVNTVFATGQGTFTTALIKDDIGNWNLKNYDNAPGELLDAYKEAGFAALNAVADVAQAAVSGGSTAAVSQALRTANKVALGVDREQADGIRTRLKTLAETSQKRILEIGFRRQELSKKANQTVEVARETENITNTALESAASEVAVAAENLEEQALNLKREEDALRAAENELSEVSSARKAKSHEYEALRGEVVGLEESGNNETLLAEKRKQREDAANELVNLQNREINQLEIVREEKETVNNTVAALAAAKSHYKKKVDEHLEKRVAHANSVAATKTAVEQLDVIRENMIIQIQQALNHHRDMIDALEKELADKGREGISLDNGTGSPSP